TRPGRAWRISVWMLPQCASAWRSRSWTKLTFGAVGRCGRLLAAAKLQPPHMRRRARQFDEIAVAVRLVAVAGMGGELCEGPARLGPQHRQQVLEPAHACIPLGRQAGGVTEPGNEVALADPLH